MNLAYHIAHICSLGLCCLARPGLEFFCKRNHFAELSAKHAQDCGTFATQTSAYLSLLSFPLAVASFANSIIIGCSVVKGKSFTRSCSFAIEIWLFHCSHLSGRVHVLSSAPQRLPAKAKPFLWYKCACSVLCCVSGFMFGLCCVCERFGPRFGPR
jgi:hypothetical protein